MSAYKYLYETHMHTSEGSKCALSTAAEQVRAYKNRGYTGIIITDHFINGYCTCPRDLPWDKKMHYVISGYTAAKAEGNRCNLDVFLGWEFTHKGLDFLTYGLGLDFLLAHPHIDRLDPTEYSKVVRENGGYIAQAHPFRNRNYIVKPKPVDPSLLDGIEVFNAADPIESNKKALKFAQEHNLAMQAGTDSHMADKKRASGIVLQYPAGGIQDIINALKSGEVELLD